MEITFELYYRYDKTKTPIFVCDDLRDMYSYINNRINITSSWLIDEIKDKSFVNKLNASYLVNNFERNNLPKTISEIINLM